MNGKVAAIFATPNAGEPLESVESAVLEKSKGIVGDRYFRQAGTFSDKLKDSMDWEVTLIESEEIQQYNETREVALSPGEFRRNVITTGIRLNDLEGQHFFVGEAELEGIRLCEPCAYLGSLLGPDVVKAMTHKAGLRARIIAGGAIQAGDSIRVSDSN